MSNGDPRAATPRPPGTEPTPPGPTPRRLGTTARTWRLGVAGAALVVLLVAQLVPTSWKNTNDWFPLGSLSQYAFATNPNGTVRSTFITGTTADGDEVKIWLDQMGIGVGHAEIEGQLQRIVDDPELLAGVARAYAWRYPNRPPLVKLTLKRTTKQLHDGRPTGEETVEVLGVYQVPAGGVK
ncbi:hypothetical protein [Luteimicrobium sp. DT211]|uniref:hypothetical protein n=1 Tax=Luteimicrobium sp. DT211 TaxID=3393412 RepID=UPI003CF46704